MLRMEGLLSCTMVHDEGTRSLRSGRDKQARASAVSLASLAYLLQLAVESAEGVTSGFRTRVDNGRDCTPSRVPLSPFVDADARKSGVLYILHAEYVQYPEENMRR